MVTMKYALAIAVTGLAIVGGIAAVTNFALGGGGSSSPANTASYTITPKGRLNEEVYFRFSGPPAAMRRVKRAFEATRKGDYTFIAQAVGQTDCEIAADGGKVTISVVTILYLNHSVAQTACDWIRGRF